MPGLLTLAITAPIIGAIVLMLIPNRDGSKDGLIRYLALAISLVVFGITLTIWAGFDPALTTADRPFQFVDRTPWIDAFNIEYYVGIDGLSLMLVVLTGFLTPLALLSS